MIDKITFAVWMSPAGVEAIRDYPEDTPRYAIVQFGTDMTSEGWVKVSENTIELRRPTFREMQAPVVASLEAEERRLRENFAANLMALRERKERLLALEAPK